jgi:predicted nucleic acid-binding protein
MRCKKIVPRIDEAPEIMRFWDASAIIPLLADEPARERALAFLEQDADILAWWGTPVEIASALARRERERLLSADEVGAALATARELADSWHEVVPSTSIRRTAERLLRVHPLRASDSLQLAAALIAADHDPATLEFVCFDSRLASAAAREGFKILDQ